MASVMIKCPKTGELVSTGIDIDFGVLEHVELQDNRLLNCPECGGTHLWQKDDVVLDS